MILVSGIKWRIILSILGGIIIAGCIVVILYISFPEQTETFLESTGLDHVEGRFNAWLNTDENTQGDAYQLIRAMLAIGSGQLTGKGIGGFEVSQDIPEFHTDMIFTSIAEQFGFFWF